MPNMATCTGCGKWFSAQTLHADMNGHLWHEACYSPVVKAESYPPASPGCTMYRTFPSKVQMFYDLARIPPGAEFLSTVLVTCDNGSTLARHFFRVPLDS